MARRPTRYMARRPIIRKFLGRGKVPDKYTDRKSARYPLTNKCCMRGCGGWEAKSHSIYPMGSKRS